MSSDANQSTPAIVARNVGKCYHIYNRPQDRLKQSLWRGRRTFYHEFWALRDVSFEVQRGDMVGLIGVNGSGKSTLLQIVAGTLMPSEGDVTVNGRVAALLELGSGFNFDFTGRENVFMNAAILGLTQAETQERFEQIASFADIGEFIDQPVKTYSSGMVVRLAFAVAVHVDADILIVDEALSVGDTAFQAKCFRRIEQLRARGVTILLATHDTQAVAAMCEHGLLLDHGKTVLWSTGKRAAEEYYRRIRESEPQSSAQSLQAAADSPPAEDLESPRPRQGTHLGDGRARITGFAVYDHAGQPARALAVRERFRIEAEIRFFAHLRNPHVGAALRDVQSRLLLGGHTLYEGVQLGPCEPGQTMRIAFEMHMNLNPGKYLLMLGIAEHEDFANWQDCDTLFDLCEICVYGKDRAWSLVDSPVTITVKSETPHGT